MPANYSEVLKDLDAQIASLEAEIATLREGRPTIVILRNRYAADAVARLPVNHVTATAPSWKSPGPYAHMGPTEAIRLVLVGQPHSLKTSEIVDKLKSGGLTTKGANLSSNIAATLSRLYTNKIVDKVGDGWKLKFVDTRTNAEVLSNLSEDLRQEGTIEPETLSLQ